MIEAIFERMCPNCGQDIDSLRLGHGLPCSRCLPDPSADGCSPGPLGELSKARRLQEEWRVFFQQVVGAPPWGLQSAWAMRVFLRRSFALLAPTGVGKTTFGISMAAFLARQGRRSYIIVPTRMLVEQVCSRLLRFGIKHDDLLGVLPTKHSRVSTAIEDGRFLVLVTTSMFLYKHHDKIPRDFDFVFIDDVDSFLKTARNVDKVLYLLGFSVETIRKAESLIHLRSRKKQVEDVQDQIAALERELGEEKGKVQSVLVAASATARPRSLRVRLFRELLGFEVGIPTFYLRNVVDTFCKGQLDPVFWIKRIGKGGLVFVSGDRGKEQVDKLLVRFSQEGIRAVAYEEVKPEVLEAFDHGEIDVLVGIASYRNPLARGVDLPQSVRYALFVGVPKLVVRLDIELHPLHLLWALTALRPHVVRAAPQLLENLDRWIKRLRRYRGIREKGDRQGTAVPEQLRHLLDEAREFLRSPDILRLIENAEDLSLRRQEGRLEVVISDVTGYLQASGRTSRMYAGGITKGLSLLLVDDECVFRHLQHRLRWFSDDITFVPIDQIDLDRILSEIDTDRRKVRSLQHGKVFAGIENLLRPVLVIVESPNKARTIAEFFGRPLRRRIGQHEVLETVTGDRYLLISSSLGHIVDLSRGVGFHGVHLNGRIVPVYRPIEGKEALIDALRHMAEESSCVLIATDPDIEGEKIAWDLYHVLKPILPRIARMEFHEVTPRAIQKALQEPRCVSEDMVRAQIVRRIADRWVGFQFSRMLWEAFGRHILSAGRVQTPVLGWIIEREAEHRQKVYKVFVSLGDTERRLRLEFVFEERKSARQFFESLTHLDVTVKATSEQILPPLPPFRTDTLLKEANERLRFSAHQTMSIAQDLFELGFITYHRTDSVRVSDVGIQLAKEYISQRIGVQYFQARSWGQGGAHECIRPTRAISPEELSSLHTAGELERLERAHLQLYALIFRRFMASQMRPVRVVEQNVCFQGGERQVELKLLVRIIEDGWNLILGLHLHPEFRDGRIPVADSKELRAVPKVRLYTQGELVEKMKMQSIGRPSTYALIVQRLIDRHYVIERKGFLIPTLLGKEVYEYLSKKENARRFLSESFTRELEATIDGIEQGTSDYQTVLRSLLDELRCASEERLVQDVESEGKGI